MLTRVDKKGRIFVPFREGAKGIAIVDRNSVPDARKWSARKHVSDEAAAARKLAQGWHMWMVAEDGSSSRASLICPRSIEGWR